MSGQITIEGMQAPAPKAVAKGGTGCIKRLPDVELTHAVLVDAAHRWALGAGGCGVAFRELVCNGTNEIADVIGFREAGEATVIECKASRSDFLRDAKKLFRKEPKMGMGRWRFFCAPHHMLKDAEMPAGWGLLEVGRTGRVVRAYRPPFHRLQARAEGAYRSGGFNRDERNTRGEAAVMYSALRRIQLRGFIEAAQVTVFDPVVCEKCHRLPVAPVNKFPFCAACGHNKFIKQRS